MRGQVVESHQSTKVDTSGTAKDVVSIFQRLGMDFSFDQVGLLDPGPKTLSPGTLDLKPWALNPKPKNPRHLRMCAQRYVSHLDMLWRFVSPLGVDWR